MEIKAMEIFIKVDRSKCTIVSAVKAVVDELTDEERVDLFHDYCVYCGSNDPNCQCWNDE